MGPVPVHLHFHGSGYIFPGHGTDGAFCSYLCKTLGIIVLDCDYRKFPSPFPNAYNDCLDLVEWCFSQADSGWDASKLTISGKSAGGGLALAVASTKNLKDKIKAVTCLYPPTDFRKSGQSHTSRQSFRSQKYDSGMPLTSGMVKLCDDAYVLDSTDRNDPRLSTILARAEDFPRHVWVGTGSCDILFVSEMSKRESNVGCVLANIFVNLWSLLSSSFWFSLCHRTKASISSSIFRIKVVQMLTLCSWRSRMKVTHSMASARKALCLRREKTKPMKPYVEPSELVGQTRTSQKEKLKKTAYLSASLPGLAKHVNQ